MNSISTSCPSVAISNLSLPVPRGLPTVNRLKEVATVAYPPLQSLGILGYGVTELVSYGITRCRAKRKGENSSVEQKVKESVQHSLGLNSPKETVAHGLLFVQAGGLGLAAIAHKHRVVSFGGFGRFLNPLSNLYFFLANVLSLCQAIRRYNAVKTLSNNHSAHPEFTVRELRRAKCSAIIGIIAAIDYILATLVSVLGLCSGIIFFMGAIAATTGCLQMLYDFFYKSPF